MMCWDALTAISTTALAIIAFFALLYAKKQLDSFHQANQIIHLNGLVDQFSREPIVSLRKQLWKAVRHCHLISLRCTAGA
jgi:hypothetical protein